MRNYWISGLACAWLAYAATAEARPSAPITDVLLYPGGATITRTVQVTPGMKEAAITGLPADFDVQTLRADASSGIRIGEIVSADVASTHAVNPAEEALEARITTLRDREAALDAEAKSSQMALDYLTHMMSREVTTPQDDGHHRPAPMMDARTLNGLADAMRSQAGKSLAHLQAIAVQKREIEKNIGALQRDLARLQSSGTDTRTLTVSFEAARAGALHISYEVGNAGWRPAYRATLDSESSRVQLERHAIISQRTGEDWSNVHLTLSTSQPRAATSGADPQPWLLSYVMEVARAGYMAAEMAAPAAAPTMRAKKEAPAEADAEQDKAPYVPPTFETQGMFANTYEVPARASLPADGREVSVELTRDDIAVKQYFQVVPRREAAVYVTAEADMPQGDWPQGAIQLFRNGSYVGRAEWNPQVRDRFVLGFGRDEQIHVSVAPLKSDSGSSGIISKRRQKHIANQFAFVNYHQQAVELKVLESAPVATSDEVEVHSAFTPKPTHENWEDKRGVMEWEIKLAPKGTAKLKTEYDIDYPSEGRLVEQR